MKRLLSRCNLLSLAGLAAVFVLTASFVGAAPTQPKPQTITDALGNWQFRYTTLRESDGTYVVIHDYARTSVTDITTAVAAMNQAADQLANGGKPFKATLVFQHPLPVAEFKQFVSDMGLSPTGNVLRAVGADGASLKVGVPPVWKRDSQGRLLVGQPVPGGDPLDSAILARGQAGPHAYHVAGVISTDVTLDSGMYQKIRHDNRVYAVDILSQILLPKVQQAYGIANMNQIQFEGSLLYPAMERAGLAPKP